MRLIYERSHFILIHEILDNGLEIVIKENQCCDLVALQCWVNAGSVQELPHQRGLAHFIEHMLFKGTQKRAVGEIAKTVEACGGDINAYTTFERTVYYLTLRSAHLETGLDLLSDAIFNSSFEAAEIEREREVIIEEIRRSLDNPSVLIGRKLFAQSFKNTEAERPIIGFAEQIKEFSRDDLVEFYSTWYKPEHMAFVGVGAFSGYSTQRLVHKYFGNNKNKGKTPLENKLPQRKFPPGVTVEIIKGDYQQPRLEFAFACPAFDHEDSCLLDVAAFALGSGEMSRLNQVLCNAKAFVTGATASVFAPRFGGIISISSAPLLKHFLDTVTASCQLLLEFKYKKGLTQNELDRAKANIKADRLYQDEGIENQAKAIGFGLTTPYKFAFDDIYIARIDAAQIKEVNEAVQRWINERDVIIVAMVPKESDLTEEKIKKAFAKGLEEFPPPSVDLAKTKDAEVQKMRLSAIKPKKIVIDSSLNLVHRQVANTPFVNLTMVAKGGLRFEDKSRAGMFYAMTEMLAKATESRSYEKLQLCIEGLAANVRGFSGKDSFGFKVSCLKEHCDAIFDILMDCFMQPVFPTQQWEILKREIDEHIQTEDDSPSQIAIRKFQELLLNGHPYSFPTYGFQQTVDQFNEKFLLEQYIKIRDQSDFIIGCVSPFPDEVMAKRLETLFKPWLSKKDRVAKSLAFAKPAAAPVAKKMHVDKDREQTHIIMGFKGLNWLAQERAHVELLSTILGGQGGRLFLRLRDHESLAYTVAPIFYFGVDPGIFATYIACAPDKKARAMEALLRELKLTTTEIVSQGELDRAKNYLLGSYEADLQHADAQAMNMALMELYGLGADDFLKYPQRLGKVTAEDILSTAKQIFTFDNIIEVTVGAAN